mmetsp:Transcript_28326/g.88276  ORF Transcript_28326/g.88276 Transcript_28326/m.88276 type:complete len:244 (-) Transcript_28326:119-850(-)
MQRQHATTAQQQHTTTASNSCNRQQQHATGACFNCFQQQHATTACDGSLQQQHAATTNNSMQRRHPSAQQLTTSASNCCNLQHCYYSIQLQRATTAACNVKQIQCGHCLQRQHPTSTQQQQATPTCHNNCLQQEHATTACNNKQRRRQGLLQDATLHVLRGHWRLPKRHQLHLCARRAGDSRLEDEAVPVRGDGLPTGQQVQFCAQCRGASPDLRRGRRLVCRTPVARVLSTAPSSSVLVLVL